MLLGSVFLVLGFALIVFANARAFARTSQCAANGYDSYDEMAFARVENGLLRAFGVMVILMSLIAMIAG